MMLARNKALIRTKYKISPQVYQQTIMNDATQNTPHATQNVVAHLPVLLQQLNQTILGKAEPITHAVTCLLAGGHLLIEDVPGVGKTTLAHALAKSMGLQFARVQFTADLMPSDLTGVSIYERAKEQFVFHPGPLFTQVLLADEINRASPKAQSALLEAMEERQVSIEGKSYALPRPFFVIATQNPLEQHGTQALPESQLDRFLMRISLGYPNRQAEYDLLSGSARRDVIAAMQAIFDANSLLQLQRQVQAIHAAQALINYLQDLLDATRNGQWFVQGLSPRAGLGILQASKARALLEGRNFVSPDDVQAVFPHTAAHRLIPVHHAGRGAYEQVQAMISATPLA